MTFLLIVTVASMLIAAIMSAVAWRLAGDERRRSDARVAALSAEIHEPEGRAFSDPYAGRALLDPLREPRLGPVPKDQVYRSDSEPTYSTLFATRRPRSGARPFSAFVVGALVVGAVGAMAVVVPRTLTRGPRVEPPAVGPVPLELVALGHERDGDQLTVHGVVRNPSTGTAFDQLTAVVFVVAPDGEYLATGRSAVEAAALQPGREATFAVTVPGAGEVGRYRVSFRTGDRVVPHLDRRHEG